MEENIVSSILQKSFQLTTGPTSEILQNGNSLELMSSSLSSFLPSHMLIVPLSYFDRTGLRVDICGTVDEDTYEYHIGYRCFDSNRSFFGGAGNRQMHSDHADDLCSIIKIEELKNTEQPLTPYKWVHPQHYSLTCFFRNLEANNLKVMTGRRYLDRMGFIIELVKESDLSSSDDVRYIDQYGEVYSYQGKNLTRARKPHLASMADLVYEIKNWPLFSKTDWSTDHVNGTKEDLGIPELFDPIADNKHRLMIELLKTTMHAYEIAKQLEIPFAFHIGNGE